MAKSNVRVWTPIGNALDAYRRRLLADDSAVYEHIWRLIHIHEATVVLLGAALASRLMQLWEKDTTCTSRLNDLRGLVTGLRENVLDESEPSDYAGSGCMGGSIGAWIDLLNRFGTTEAPDSCPFCKALKEYLTTPGSEPVAFLLAWQRIGNVPSAYGQKLTRVQRFNAINSLRNKIAHVPLPEKVIEDLHSGLRAELVDLLTPESDKFKKDALADILTKEWHAPLKGKLAAGRSFVTGASDFGKVVGGNDPDTKFVWSDSAAESSKEIEWSATPFVRLDGELKVAVLFRVPELRSDPEAELIGEFHRFAAEVEPVIELQITAGTLTRWIPKKELPKVTTPEKLKEPVALKSVQQPKPAKPEKLTPAMLRSKAEEAFRTRNYSEAAGFFTELSNVKESHFYNDVAKSKHGASLWRAANDNLSDENKVKGIRDAIKLLKDASNHRDPVYSARAFYEASKAVWNLWKVEHKPEQFAEAKELAEKAATLAFDTDYITWHERLVKTEAS
jgi:hypothetical protein